MREGRIILPDEVEETTVYDIDKLLNDLPKATSEQINGYIAWRSCEKAK